MHESAKRLYEAARDLRGANTPSEVARLLGESQQTLKNWEYRGLSSQGTLKAQALIGCRAEWLATGKGPMATVQNGGDGGQSKNRPTLSEGIYEDANTEEGPALKGEIPVISWVAAGNAEQVVDNYQPGHGDDTVQVTIPVKRHTFCLKVKGDSMTDPSGNGPSFPEGILIAVEPDMEATHKDFVIVKSRDEDEANFKQLIIDGKDMYLKPLNPTYKTKPFPEDGRICGVVREAIWKLK